MGLINFTWQPVAFAAVALPLVYLIYVIGNWGLSARRPKDFPPGPSPIFGLGNALQLPLEKAFLKFHEWKGVYGDMVGLKIGSQNIVVLQNADDVRELWEKRGAIYSDRPQMYVPSEIINPGTIFFMNNGHAIKKTRTALRHLFGPAELRRALMVQSAQSAILMRKILQDPGALQEHLKHWAFATPLAVMSGQEVQETGPASTATYFETQKTWLRFLTPAQAPPIEIFPFLKYLPDFLAQWRRDALALREDMFKTMYHMLDGAKLHHDNISKGLRGTQNESVMTRLLREGDDSKDLKFGDHELALFGSGTLDAAVDTVIATTCSIILIYGAFPGVQKRIQEEVDAIWPDKVPGPEELAQATYLKAVLMESMRWRPAAPSGVPRALSRDDTYRGFRFPKGTVFMMNTWSIHRDEEWFDRPGEFMPERYVDNRWGVRPEMRAAAEKQNRRPTYNFGAGRRMCPGLDYAENQMLVTMAKLAWGFDVVARGRLDCSIDGGYHSDLVMGPKPFDVDFVPRGEARANKIVKESEEAKRVLSSWVE